MAVASFSANINTFNAGADRYVLSVMEKGFLPKN
jgi:hypothetical protein